MVTKRHSTEVVVCELPWQSVFLCAPLETLAKIWAKEAVIRVAE